MKKILIVAEVHNDSKVQAVITYREFTGSVDADSKLKRSESVEFKEVILPSEDMRAIKRVELTDLHPLHEALMLYDEWITNKILNQ